MFCFHMDSVIRLQMKTRDLLAPKVPPKVGLQRLNLNSVLPATHFTKSLLKETNITTFIFIGFILPLSGVLQSWPWSLNSEGEINRPTAKIPTACCIVMLVCWGGHTVHFEVYRKLVFLISAYSTESQIPQQRLAELCTLFFLTNPDAHTATQQQLK